MTEEQRAKLLKFIDEYTAKNTVSQKVAREALIREGIYTKDGNLRPEFGGPPLEKRQDGF